MYQTNGQIRGMRKLVEEARRLAVERRWDEAAAVNRQIVERAPRDVEAHNRLGKALMELGRFDEAIAAYETSLQLDPTNAIAQRQVARLRELAEMGPGTYPPTSDGRPPIRADVFVEEIGKTYVTDLIRPTTERAWQIVAPADEVELRIEGNRVQVYAPNGTRLGQLEPAIGDRLIELIQAGNRYQAYVVALTGNTIRIIIREVFRNPELPAGMSLPRQVKIAAPRPYLRDAGLMERELAPDLLLDEDEEDESIEGDDEEEEELEGIDPLAEEEEVEEDEAFLAEPLVDEEEESPLEP